MLTCVSLSHVDERAADLRLHADHCRRLANGIHDERTRSILQTMAGEFDRQAADLEAPRAQIAEAGTQQL
jgi:hypothetical protein